MNFLNKIIIKSLPYIPKILVKVFSKRYVAGINNSEALHAVKTLNINNLYTTIDILGEHTLNNKQCTAITNNYLELLDLIKEKDLKCNLSIKPSHIGLDINFKTVLSNFSKITDKAKELNNFIRIDMESSKSTDESIKLYNKLRQKDKNIGIVFQAYLKRTEADIKKLNNSSNIRLCKGIYNESEKIAFKNPDKINDNFLKLLEIIFKKGIYVGIATHDTVLINSAIKLINKMNISNDKFEFQYLHGVPMDHMVKIYKQSGFKTRVYVPFGKNWYDYSIRRVKENPQIATYVLKNIFLSENNKQ